jgi:hypothetical protein
MKRSMITASMLVLGVVLSGCYFSERKTSNEIIARVDQFRKSTGRLPETLSDIGIEENESCPCYCKTNSDSYMVWYGTTLGESDTYNSRTKQWSEAAGLVCAVKAPVLTN